MAETKPSPIGRMVGNFRIAERLGGGGMGDVYLLRHRQLPNVVAALKVLRADQVALPYVKERFVQEALVAAAVGSDRVARPIDLGRFDDGSPYIIFELATGQTLAQTLSTRGPLPVTTALRIAHRVADTMALVHARGIVHRDLKPSNLMLDGDLDDPRIKILDFGVARPPLDLRIAQTVENAIVGSPGYMSPEAATGDAADARSDVFSLGATLYNCLTLAVPFPTETVVSLLSDPAPTIAAKRSVSLDPAPEALETLVAKMLAKRPTDRPSMLEVRDAIGELADIPPESIAESAAPAIVAISTDDPVASTITSGRPAPVVDLAAIRAQLEQLVDASFRPPRARRRSWLWVAAASFATIVVVLVAFRLSRDDSGVDQATLDWLSSFGWQTAQTLTENISPLRGDYTVLADSRIVLIGDRALEVLERGRSPRTVHTPDGLIPGAVDAIGPAAVLVFGRSRAPNVTELWRIDIASSDARRVLSDKDPALVVAATDSGRMRVSPDGSSVLLTSASELLIVELASGKKRSLLRLSADEHTQCGAWLRDGSGIVFVHATAEGQSLVKVGLDGSRKTLLANRRLTHPSLTECGGVTAVDDRTVVVLAYEDQPEALAVPIAGGVPRLVHRWSSAGRIPVSMTWTADHVVHRELEIVDRHVEIFDATGATATRLEGAVPTALAGWVGGRLIYNGRRGEAKGVFAQAPDEAAVAWSDGDDVVHAVSGDDVFAVSNNQLVRITSGERSVLGPANGTVHCAADGMCVVIGDGVRPVVTRLARDGSTSDTLGELVAAPFRACGAALSPSGRFLAITAGEAVEIRDLVQSSMRTIATHYAIAICVAWVDEQRIVVTGIGLGLETFAMITIDVVTNEADTLAHHDRVSYGQVRPHRDGRLAVIAAKFDVALKSIAR